MMILMRITDFLRSMRFITLNGYPEQALTLASSIFELSHTAAYFLHNPEAVDKWYSCDDIQAKMPNLIGVNDYKNLVKKNYSYKDLEAHSDNEYKVYKQLCWMKHSHPIMQDLLLIDNNIQFPIGPYTDEKSINHAWFTIEHSGRLTELVIGNLVNLKDEESIKSNLESLAKIRGKLHQKVLARFGSNDPFK